MPTNQRRRDRITRTYYTLLHEGLPASVETYRRAVARVDEKGDGDG